MWKPLNWKSFLIEAYGPGGTALLISGITDNKNRSLGEIKQILSRRNGKMVDGGAVRWMFSQKGVVTLLVDTTGKKEEIELAAIEAGADDLYWRDNTHLDIYTSLDALEQLKEQLATTLPVESFSLDWVPNEHIQLSEQDRSAYNSLIESLEEEESVQRVYSNA